jgi:hypothetical protein
MKAQVIQKGSRTLIQIDQRPIIHQLEGNIKFLQTMIKRMETYQNRGGVWYCLPSGQMVNVKNALKDFEGDLRTAKFKLLTEKCIN